MEELGKVLYLMLSAYLHPASLYHRPTSRHSFRLYLSLPYANYGVVSPVFASRSFYLVTAMSLVSLFVVVLSLARINVGQDPSNLFIFPTAPGPSNNYVADLSFTLGSTQKIQWTTTLETYHITLLQQAIGPTSGNELMTIYSM